MNPKLDFKIYTDGGSRGNPGEAACGFVIYDEEGSKIYEEGKRLGIQTNNYAEYSGIIAALKYLSEQSSTIHHSPSIIILMDSKLAAEQLSGKWKIKNESLRNLFFTIKKLEQKLGAKVEYQHIPREQNTEADALVNLALDNMI